MVIGRNMNTEIQILIPKEEVKHRIRQLAEEINQDYSPKELHMISVLKGGVFFSCELSKYMKMPVTMDFMCVSSYGNRTFSQGEVTIVKDLEESIENKDVLLVEDIVDSGNTLSFLMDLLKKRGPKSLRLCTLLDKPERREKQVNIDYTGFRIPDRFVVGYGLDYNQKYRNLPYIGWIDVSSDEESD